VGQRRPSAAASDAGGVPVQCAGAYPGGRDGDDLGVNVIGDVAAYVEVSVSDDGPGIDAALLPHLFERFVRADKSRSRDAGSFGLDLSIAASIAETHGGTVQTQSDSRRTTFSFHLPVAAEASVRHRDAESPAVR
jgi:signal transduction histidine kinase